MQRINSRTSSEQPSTKKPSNIWTTTQSSPPGLRAETLQDAVWVRSVGVKHPFLSTIAIPAACFHAQPVIHRHDGRFTSFSLCSYDLSENSGTTNIPPFPKKREKSFFLRQIRGFRSKVNI